MNNLFTSALLIFALIIPITTYAYDFEVNGIYYNINGNEATVTYNDGEYNNSDYYSGHVTIPSYVTYNGK